MAGWGLPESIVGTSQDSGGNPSTQSLGQSPCGIQRSGTSPSSLLHGLLAQVFPNSLLASSCFLLAAEERILCFQALDTSILQPDFDAVEPNPKEMML